MGCTPWRIWVAGSDTYAYMIHTASSTEKQAHLIEPAATLLCTRSCCGPTVHQKLLRPYCAPDAAAALLCTRGCCGPTVQALTIAPEDCKLAARQGRVREFNGHLERFCGERGSGAQGVILGLAAAETPTPSSTAARGALPLAHGSSLGLQSE